MPLPDLDARITGAQAALAIGVSKQLINYWRTTGRLTPGADRRYRWGDIIEAEHATRHSPHSSRHQRHAA